MRAAGAAVVVLAGAAEDPAAGRQVLRKSLLLRKSLVELRWRLVLRKGPGGPRSLLLCVCGGGCGRTGDPSGGCGFGLGGDLGGKCDLEVRIGA